ASAKLVHAERSWGAGEHLGLAFRRAAEMHHLEARSVVGADAECRNVIVGALAAGVERNRTRAALGLVDDVLYGFELAVGSHRPKIGIDDMIDQRREALQVLRVRAALCSVKIDGSTAGRVDVADGVAVGLRRGERAPTDPAAAA